MDSFYHFFPKIQIILKLYAEAYDKLKILLAQLLKFSK